MKIIDTAQRSFEEEFRRIRMRKAGSDASVEETVRGILEDVRENGDEALFRYTERFDGVRLSRDTVEVSRGEIERAVRDLDGDVLGILETAAERIERFHRNQILHSWRMEEEDGAVMGQEIVPLGRVGVYAPGGLAPYPSTVLMGAVPARVAGVREIFLATPAKQGGVSPLLLAAAHVAGVTRVFRMGGAQAVAALAYGTESVPAVDKIVGPGNLYVATAKRLVFGDVGIDMIAGPSEIVVVSDGTGDPEVIAADLLSQAEHDETACALFLTPDRELARKVSEAADRQLGDLSREAIARKAMERFGRVIVTAGLDEALYLANRFSPEHLELMVRDPEALLPRITSAGAVFLGEHTPEALGDYLAGPNHILPTGGTARFSSPLGVYDFVKRMSVLRFSPAALRRCGEQVVRFAGIEGLDAHGRAVSFRIGSKKS
ncbi:MAG TPA: histidinol dehydrogenase [Syntrophales bacterium]|nr:histidinol dehydrogenase [Syntrophales bacterium]HQQ27231.1 histidinol dehydrogenase [Syntrophales bacterium]